MKMKMMKMIPESKICQSGKANNKKKIIFSILAFKEKEKNNASNVEKMKRVIQLRLRSIQAFVVRK